MPVAYKRQFTSTEKIYVAHGLISPPCVSQIVFEGTGFLDKQKWRDAIRLAGDANPGSSPGNNGFPGLQSLDRFR